MLEFPSPPSRRTDIPLCAHSRPTHDIPSSPHIFYFDHMKARLVNGVPQLPTPPYTTRDAVVNVNTGSFLSSGNDLLSRLTDVMGLYSEPQGPQQELEFNAILEPSQVLAFQLSHGSSYVGGYYQASAHATHDGFRFPTSFFLDQFLMQNVETALQLRDARLGMLADIRQCQGRRSLLTRFEVCRSAPVGWITTSSACEP